MEQDIRGSLVPTEKCSRSTKELDPQESFVNKYSHYGSMENGCIQCRSHCDIMFWGQSSQTNTVS
jgi:hypothetical protein